MSFGEKIAELRRKNGMTQNDLGKAMNVSYQAVSKWERDESQPDFETMSKIAKLFDVPISYFEEGEAAYSGNAYPNNANVYYAAPTKAMLGTCTECGKIVYEDEEGETMPKLVCKACVERKQQKAAAEQAEEERTRRWQKETEAQEKIGSKFDVKMIVAVCIAFALYILFTVLAFIDVENADMYSVLLAFVPLCGFGITFAIADFIADLRDKDDEESYCLITSLVTAAGFAVVNVALFLTLYLALDENVLFLILLGVTAVASFTFISQFMWGGVVGEIFSMGGFTFKLPGFIFSLSFDSILWMIITKIFLAVVAAIVYVVTTAIAAIAAILGSVFIFIPSLLRRIYATRKAKQELKAL